MAIAIGPMSSQHPVTDREVDQRLLGIIPKWPHFSYVQEVNQIPGSVYLQDGAP